MFTLEQIKTAHGKVQSGADFPAYIQEIRTFGVTAFETWVSDSHTDYFGEDGYQVSSAPMYEPLEIANESKAESFRHYLQIHQQGQTDYFTFCHHCAESGIEKWFVSLQGMTCTYYDKKGRRILEELIPG